MGIKNALTVDVEDWFHVSLFRHKIRRDEWEQMKPTVVENTCRVLNLFAQKNVKATFFVLGWVAERYPEIVTTIKEFGHEIASHGYGHQIVYELSPEEFFNDIEKSLKILQDLTGDPVQAYRAPSYSITKSSMWAWETLAQLGIKYDSSIFPVKHDLYGIPDAPRFPFEIRLASGPALVEFPLSTVVLMGKNIPMAGGGYLRLYPYWFIRNSMRRINAEGKPAILYFHPWEVDPELPRIPLGSFKTLRHYGNICLTEERLQRLLDEFAFGTLSEVLKGTSIQNDWPRTFAAGSAPQPTAKCISPDGYNGRNDDLRF
ncbi:MAG: XrtA system polysaccharide deacetylase [bacterium]